METLFKSGTPPVLGDVETYVVIGRHRPQVWKRKSVRERKWENSIALSRGGACFQVAAAWRGPRHHRLNWLVSMALTARCDRSAAGKRRTQHPKSCFNPNFSFALFLTHSFSRCLCSSLLSPLLSLFENSFQFPG